jgi:hypothetical protein
MDAYPCPDCAPDCKRPCDLNCEDACTCDCNCPSCIHERADHDAVACVTCSEFDSIPIT